MTTGSRRACTCRTATGKGRSPGGAPRARSTRAVVEFSHRQLRFRVSLDRCLTPPLSQIKISLSAASLVDGKNQKKRSSPASSVVTGIDPAYDSPTSKSTSGIAVPSTENSINRRLGPSSPQHWILTKDEENGSRQTYLQSNSSETTLSCSPAWRAQAGIYSSPRAALRQEDSCRPARVSSQSCPHAG